MKDFNRLEMYILAKDALAHLGEDVMFDDEITFYTNGVMDMFRPDYKAEHRQSIYDCTGVLNTLDELMGSNGIVEDEEVQLAFDLICDKCVFLYSEVSQEFTDEKFNEWTDEVLTRWKKENGQ